jgi:polyribonucleotide nucleotidyltransferase
MIPQLFVESIDLGDGRNITIETGRLKQADGSVVVRGKTVILGTVVSARKASPVDFLPLTVDYRKNLLQQVSLAVSSKKDQVITKY